MFYHNLGLLLFMVLFLASVGDQNMEEFSHYVPGSTKISSKKFHVFLSFRGKDVRRTFIDHLYEALSADGLRVFLDSEELKKGQIIYLSLQTAIENSAILIPVFSKGYASSAWCLREATLMVRSQGFIIPLFYDVQPTHVRYPESNLSPYAPAFKKHYGHLDRYQKEEIDGWKKALEQICSRSGWTIDDTNGFEAQLIKKVSYDVINTLDSVPLKVAKHPVGLERAKIDIQLAKIDIQLHTIEFKVQLIKKVTHDVINTVDSDPLEVAKHPLGLERAKIAINQYLNLVSANNSVASAGLLAMAMGHSRLFFWLLSSIDEVYLVRDRILGIEKSSKTALGIVGGVIVAIVICIIAMIKKLKSGTSGRPVTVVTCNEEIRDYTPESEAIIKEPSFIFNLKTLAEATENFHEKNKLGQGAFGAVYMGRTKDDKQIAVKKLFARGGAWEDEFMNEVKLVANIRHRNLAKILGYCAEADERLIIYEYLPNKSLDTILFNPEKRRQLDWQKRYNIILGIARGLRYLHSQLRIIHRDIKASNILIDEKQNAKIADFDLARLLPKGESHIETGVAGTYGYLAPEYAMTGQLSAKADVYSFGVLLLEILSGRRNIDPIDHMKIVVECAWRLYQSGDILNLVDATITERCPREQVLRCIHVGLLCVQADAALRPTMSNVITMMMSSDPVTMRNLTKPGFFGTGQSIGSSSNSSVGLGNYGEEAKKKKHSMKNRKSMLLIKKMLNVIKQWNQ